MDNGGVGEQVGLCIDRKDTVTDGNLGNSFGGTRFEGEEFGGSKAGSNGGGGAAGAIEIFGG